MTALEYATDTKAMVVGKPEKTFFLEALRDADCAPEEAVMIGDVSTRPKEMSCSSLPVHGQCVLVKTENSFFFLYHGS